MARGPMTGTIDSYTAPTLEALLDLMRQAATDSGRAGYVLRSVSHAVDPTADPAERYSAVAYYSRLLQADVMVVTPEQMAEGRRAVGLPVDDS